MGKPVELIMPLSDPLEERQAKGGFLEALIVSPDPEVWRFLAGLVGQGGLTPVQASTVEKARETIVTRPICLVFAEEILNDGDPKAIVDMVAGAGLPVPLIVLSRRDDWPHYLRILRRGASDCLRYPLRVDEVVWAVRRALRPLYCESGEAPRDLFPVFRQAGGRRAVRRAGRRIPRAMRKWISSRAATRLPAPIPRWAKGQLDGARRGGA